MAPVVERWRGTRGCLWHPGVAAAAAVTIAVAFGSAHAAGKSTFTIDYVVTISAKNTKLAKVRWELSGIDEIQEFRLHFPPDRFDGFAGSGSLERSPGQIRWVPGGPYAHLTYVVHLDHLRGHQQRYDSYAGRDWVVARARDVFPRTVVQYEPRGKQRPKSHARLIFHLPPGWRSVTVHEPAGPNTFALFEPDKVLDRPRGWLALGKIDIARQEIAGTTVQVARVPATGVSARDLFGLYESTLPAMKKLFPRAPERIVIVTAPDPMWRGGISATDSFFMHANRPLRTPDKTSPYLHELFHIFQPYKPARDADWIEEGLAEYYSLELQRRSGLVDATAFGRGLDYFERYGLWQVDITQQQDNAATNNSAPLIMYALDQRIQRDTSGTRRLDDVVTALAEQSDLVVDTARFQHVVEKVAGKRFRVFFRRHVREGVPPLRQHATR